MSGPGIKEFLVPDLGEGLEDASVVCWNVAVGDVIELNQTLCSLETAKAEVEIPSPYAGRIVELCGAEGDVLEVGSALVRIDTRATESDPIRPRRRRLPGTVAMATVSLVTDTARKRAVRCSSGMALTPKSTVAEGKSAVGVAGRAHAPRRRYGSWPPNFSSTSKSSSRGRAPAE